MKTKASAPPATLLASLDDEQRARTTEWWSTLNDDARVELADLWDARTDDTALYGARGEDGALTWHKIPIELRGALIDEQNDIDHKQAKQQLLEYIANHEDIQFFLLEKRFHICRAHPAARAVIRAGHLPADFECPNDDERCPMRAILDACPGKSVRLSAALRLIALCISLVCGALACSGEPTSCEEAACDPDTELCRLFGSDTLAPSTARCEALPAACADAPDCACLLDAEPDNSIAECEERDGLFVVIIPGG